MKNYSFIKAFFLIAFFTLTSLTNIQAQFTPGNLVVLKVGNGVDTLFSLGNPCYIQEYTAFGTLMNTIALPTTGANPYCISGSASSEGQLTRSADGSQVCFAGYKITPPYTMSLSSSSAIAVKRVVAKINQFGTISTAAETSTAFSTNNIRSAVSDGNDNYWAAGGTTGVYHFGSLATDTAIVSSTSTSIRYIAIFNSQLYYITNKGTFGLYLVGAGTPTTAGQISTNLIATGPTSSPFAFSMNSTSDTCYIADDRVTTSGGGIQKWVKNSGIWTLSYTLGTGITSTVGCRSIAVNWNAPFPIIYATTAETVLNRIIKIIDNSPTAIATSIAVSPTKTLFRGIAFAPDNNAIPFVSTTSYSNLSSYSVNITGNVINNGVSPITARGICWNTSPNPVITNSHSSETGTIGSFTSIINGLSPTTLYYARAYATNATSTYYGNEITVYTPPYVPVYTIPQVKGINAQGVADSNNVYCKLTGIVHGFNYTTLGLSFYILDANGGINVFNSASNFGYNVTEGDQIRVIGRILQTRGLIEIAPDSIILISSGNPLHNPQIINSPNDTYESWLVKIDSLVYISGWPTIAGPTATVKARNGIDTISIAIYTQCPLQGTSAPTSLFTITGIVSQYTPNLTPPFIGSYMVLPRSTVDFASVSEIQNEDELIIFPNPGNGKFNILTKHDNPLDVSIFSAQGKQVYHHIHASSNSTVDISQNAKGIYLLKLSDRKTNTFQIRKLIIQ